MSLQSPSPIALVCLALTGAACVHAPPPRPLAGGETIELGTVALQIPSEPGWLAMDREDGDKRTLWLRHDSAAGPADVVATIQELPLPPRARTPSEFLEWVRPVKSPESEAATFSPAPSEAYLLDDRFGPLSVRGSLRFEPKHPESKVRPGRYDTRTFVPAAQPARLVVATATSTRSDAETSKEGGLLEGLRLRVLEGPGATPAGSAPDVSMVQWAAVALGPASALVDGELIFGGAVRVAAAGEASFPRMGNGYGAALTISSFLGGNEELTASSVTLGFGLHAARGRYRYGAGVDLGVVSFEQPGGTWRRRFAIGPRASASFDVYRRGTSAIALEAEVFATTPGLYQAAVNLVTRFDAGALRPTPASP